MNIVIRSYLSGSFLLEREPHSWDAIVILDSRITNSEFVAQTARRHIYLRFDDVDAKSRDKRHPTSQDVQFALDFAKHSENLMVCCRAGQSRSAAVAFLICHQRQGPAAAYRLLRPDRHAPNPRIIDLGAQLTNDSLIHQTFHKWRTENKHVKLVDYLTEIEREIDALEEQGAKNRIIESL